MGAFRLLLFAVLISNAVCFLDDYREEDFDLRDDNFVRRQTWPKFQTKHVVVASSTIRNVNYWNNLARNRLGSFYGSSRPRQTFIRVKNLNEISNAYKGNLQVCPFNRNYYKSNAMFDVIYMSWGGSSYSVSYEGPKYICTSVDNHRRPDHFAGFVY